MTFFKNVSLKLASAFFMISVSSATANSCADTSVGSEEVVNWTNLNPSTSPPNRFSPCFTFDPPSGQIILFGGINGDDGTYYDDTWAFDATSNTWTELSPAISPAARDSARMDFDPTTGKIILFTGHGVHGYLGDTWTYDSATNTWTEVTPAVSPPPRNGASMAYDPTSGCMLLFGGFGYNEADYDDTWAYNASENTWTQITPIGSPPARDSASMAFDEAGGQIILFGGYSNNTGGNLLNDTWSCVYDDVSQTYTWNQLFPDSSPSGRYGSAMTFNPCSGQIVLFGGGYLTSTSNDTWGYDGVANTWTELNALNAPSSREFAGFAFNPPTSQTILYNGVNLPSDTVVTDTQALTFGFSPVFTSAVEVAFETGVDSSFTVTTTGFPNPTITEAGTLPANVTFVDNGDGSATISGVPNPDTVGVYELTFTASNGIDPDVTQNFTFVVLPVLPPTDFIGQIKWYKYSSGGVLSTTWNESSSADIISYRIYKNGQLVDEVLASSQLVFTTCVTSLTDAEKYQVAAVNSDNLVSPSVPVTITP